MANTKTASLVTITDLTDAPIGILSNESFVLAADLNGVVGSFSGASTTLSIKLGGVDDSANWSVSAGTPVGITGSLSGKTYTVAAMSADVGYVDLTASRAGFSNIIKRFSVAKAKQGAKGDTGATGATGAQGKGISSTVVEYKASSSGTSTPADPWSSTVPSVADNQYLWTRTTINYTDGTNTKAYSVGKMGAQGPQGNTGATGAAGVGISSTSVTYQAGSSGTTAPTGTWSATVPTVADNQFLWTKVVINYTSGSPTTSYSVGKMGAQGPQGAKGDTGAKGATGAQGPKGDTGVSITGVSERYLATASSSGVTTSTSGWTEAIQTMTATNKYLWNYEIISFSDGSSSPTLPVIIGVYGDKGNTGATGRALTAVTEYYLASPSASGITRPATDGTGGWTTTMQVTTPTNKYLWNYERLTWSVAPLTTYVEPIIIGIHGDKGDTGAQGPQGTAGVSITSVDVEYGKSSSATTAPTSWSTAAPTWESGKYIWSRVKTTYSSGSPTYTNAACITGQAGQTGGTGRGVASIVEQYAVSTSKTTVPSEASFSTDRPTWEPGKYVWTRSLITYTSGSPATSTTTPIVSSEWEAVNEIQVGGRNLIVNSSAYRASITATLQTYDIVEDFLPRTYTFSQKIQGAANTTYTLKQNNGGTIKGNLTNTGNGVFQLTFVSSQVDPYLQNFTITQSPLPQQIAPNPEPEENLIVWAKLEYGNIKTDYTETPEDAEANLINQLKGYTGNKISIFNQDEAPIDAKKGDIWIKITDPTLQYIYTGIEWLQFGERSIDALNADINAISNIAFGGAKVYRQDTQPTNQQEGDIWIELSGAGGVQSAAWLRKENTWEQLPDFSNLLSAIRSLDSGMQNGDFIKNILDQNAEVVQKLAQVLNMATYVKQDEDYDNLLLSVREHESNFTKLINGDQATGALSLQELINQQKLDSELEKLLKDFKLYFNQGEDYITIGRKSETLESLFSVKIDNQKLSFMYGDASIAHCSASDFNMEIATIDQYARYVYKNPVTDQQVGEFQVWATSDGGLQGLWIQTTQ